MKYKFNFDALYYGILAGIVGGLTQSILTRPLVWFHIIDAGVFEHAKNIILGQNIRGYLPSLIGLICHLSYSGLWGGIFAFLITKFPGHSYVKGTGVGILAYLAVMFTTSVLRKHAAGREEALHAIILLAGGALFGFVTAWTYGRLTRRFKKSFN